MNWTGKDVAFASVICFAFGFLVHSLGLPPVWIAYQKHLEESKHPHAPEKVAPFHGHIEQSSGCEIVEIKIDHIPGVLPAMEKWFAIDDLSRVETLTIHDEVDGTLRFETDGKNFTILEMRKAKKPL